MRFVFLLLCAGLALGQDLPSVSDLSRRVQTDKDGLDPKVLAQLGEHGTPEALSALERALRLIKEDKLRADLYLALAEFADEPELAARAQSLLENEVRKGKGEAFRLAAARAVLRFDPVEAAMEWAVEHKDESVRTLLHDALVVHRAESQDPDAVRAIFEGGLALEAGVFYLGVGPARAALLAQMPHREVVRDSLAIVREPAARAVLAQALGDRKLDRVWKLILLRLLRDDHQPATNEAFAAACADRDSAVALLAVDFLIERVDQLDRGPALEPLLEHSEASLRRAAIVGLGVVEKGSPEFRERLLGFARSKDEALRMGAAAALAEVRTPEALDALVAMIPDESWSVRVEVLHQLLKARPKQAIPVLIERMTIETGRLESDVHAALVGITAMDLGRLPAGWVRWWENEGSTFRVPGAAQAQTALNNRTKQDRGGTTTLPEDFYEIEVESERVVFVLDTSGSMRLTVKTVGTLEKSRMEVAKEQLTRVVRSLPDGNLFNVIFFEETVKALSRKTLVMNKSNRAKALRFVHEQYAIGSTALYPALQLAFADPLVDTVYLLSDGAPTVGELTDIEEIRAEVARWNAARHVKIHGISMGQDSTLLRWLCEDTGGTYKRVD
ncbi:MAG: HEAT repeat domain-containing protein [Planctomycetota bacterium]|nr:HEAT repeat domain-containing protein [Planctomycetota bacterium]